MRYRYGLNIEAIDPSQDTLSQQAGSPLALLLRDLAKAIVEQPLSSRFELD